MHLTHSQLPGVESNLSCLQPVSQLQPAAAIRAINPSAEDDCDWFLRQTINLFPFSAAVDVQNSAGGRGGGERKSVSGNSSTWVK